MVEKEKEKKVEIKITAEEQQLILKGIRPEGIDYNVFKKVRKDMEKALKMYLGGQFKHVSVNYDVKLPEVRSQWTYRRKTPRRHETLGRKWQRDRNK